MFLFLKLNFRTNKKKMRKFNLTDNEIREKLIKWNECRTINPFTNRKIMINGPTYKNIEKKYIKIFDIFYKNKNKSKIEIVIYNIFSDKNFNVFYDLELKKYLYILVFLEFRTRELYLQYINIPEKLIFKKKTNDIGQPFKNVRLIFYELIRLNKIPNYVNIMANDKISNNNINEIKILYKSYHELLFSYTFENKCIITKKEINFEKMYIIEEFKDTKEYFNKTDMIFKKNPKYNNIKNIHNSMDIDINNLLCDNCGKKGPKLKCSCGVNIYCNEKCSKIDFKNHYENCKLYI